MWYTSKATLNLLSKNSMTPADPPKQQNKFAECLIIFIYKIFIPQFHNFYYSTTVHPISIIILNYSLLYS